MDIFSPTIIDNAIITGSNNASLLQVSSPSAASAFFISGSGNIGIGTTSPLSTLTVEGGNINIGAGRGIGGNFVGTYTSFITYHNDGLGFLQSASFGFRRSAYMDSIAYPDAFGFGTNDLRFFTSTNGIAFPSEIMRIVGSTGFVGIGETSPSAKLEIKGSGATSATTALRVENSSATSLLTILNDGTSAFNTSHLYVSSSGNVGIGTNVPYQKLYVDGDIGLKAANFLNLAGDQGSSRTAGFQFSGASYDKIFVYTNNATIGSFSQDNGWGIGGSFTPSSRLQVRGSGATSATNTLRVENSAATPSLIIQDDGRTFVGEDYTFTSAQRYYLLEASADGLVTFTNSTTTNGQTNGFLSGELYLAGTQPFTNHRAINVITTNRNTSTSNILRAFYASGRTGNSGAANTVAGFLGGVNIEGSGNVTNAIGLEIELYSQTNNKTITNMYGVKVQPLINSVGTITNTYGLYIDSLTAGTQSNAAYGIYQAGTDKNYFAGNLGIKTTSPSASLHISGASNSGLLKIDSPAVNNIIYVSGSGNVGIGTATPTNTLQVSGGVTATSFTGSLLGTASLAQNALTASFLPTGTYNITSSWATNAVTASFLNGAFLQNGNSFGAAALLGTNDNQNLQFETNGTVRMHISSSGNVGVGLTNPSALLHVSGAAADRLLHVGSPSQANILFVTGSGKVGIGTSTPDELLSVVRSGNPKIIAGDNVGIQTTPGEWIDLYSDPASSKYIQITADQYSNSPTQYTSSPNKIYGTLTQDANVLGTPDYWMEIKLGGGPGGAIVLIPCYLPE